MNHLIVVQIDKKGQFTYSDFATGREATEIEVRRGDRIAWYVSRDGKPAPYSITFKSASPFGKKSLKVEKGGLSPLAEVTAAWSGVGMQYGVRLNSRLEDDPEIRIDNPDDLPFTGHESVPPRPGQLRKTACAAGCTAAPGDWLLFVENEDFTLKFDQSPFASGETTLRSRGGKTASRKLAHPGQFPYTAKLKSGPKLEGTLTVEAAMTA